MVAKRRAVVTGSDAPIEVQRLLKSYDPAALRWNEPAGRYVIVREVLVRGDRAAKNWLRGVLPTGTASLKLDSDRWGRYRRASSRSTAILRA